MARPTENDYPPFYHNYILKVKGNSIEEIIDNYSKQFEDFIQSIPLEKEDYAYAEHKWTVKDVLQHLIDAERVFVYRATRFSRKDATVLPGFNENEYAQNAHASNRNFYALKNEVLALRISTDLFLQSLSQEQLILQGNANGNLITVNAIAYIIYGHFLHHINVLKERYL